MAPNSVMDHLKPNAAIMGVLNLTPDSFFDGSRAASLDAAKRAVTSLWEEGADLIDIGAESTRPGAHAISTQEELDRLLPLLSWLNTQSIPFSIDTRKPAVMAAVLPFKPSMINDVCALQAPGALETVAGASVDVCLMHMQNDPEKMQENPQYSDIISEIVTFFKARIFACEQAGIDKSRLYLDPGFGFGKTLQHNIKMLQSLQVFSALGCRLLVGMSRKAMIGAMLNKPVNDRLYGSLAAHTVALLQGADMVRTHDVLATRDTLTVLHALQQEIR